MHIMRTMRITHAHSKAYASTSDSSGGKETQTHQTYSAKTLESAPCAPQDVALLVVQLLVAAAPQWTPAAAAVAAAAL